jgi:hypothetical protein
VIGSEYKKYTVVRHEDFFIDDPYDVAFESYLISLLQSKLGADRIKIRKFDEWVRLKGKKIEFHSWILQW